MKTQLFQLEEKTLAALDQISDLNQLQELETKCLGRKGELTQILRGVKTLPEKDRPKMGQLANKIKKELEHAFEQKKMQLETLQLARDLKTEKIDLTAPAPPTEPGHIHPLSQVQFEVENIFQQMGFSIMDGPEVESEHYNFECLNIPAHHPARDMQDTFFIDKKPDAHHKRLVLRTHTSPVQIRSMKKYGAPLRVIVPGRTFRYEAIDASHDATFSQVEGLLIDKNISLTHLKGIMKEFLSRLFGFEAKVRFRPGYFPFVEPGLELDISCFICKGKGCRTCSQTGWLEFMGAGMVHPAVLKAGNINPKKYQGWAFGFGLTRLTMMKYGIDDIRLLNTGDLRFVRQF